MDLMVIAAISSQRFDYYKKARTGGREGGREGGKEGGRSGQLEDRKCGRSETIECVLEISPRINHVIYASPEYLSNSESDGMIRRKP